MAKSWEDFCQKSAVFKRPRAKFPRKGYKPLYGKIVRVWDYLQKWCIFWDFEKKGCLKFFL